MSKKPEHFRAVSELLFKELVRRGGEESPSNSCLSDLIRFLAD